MGIVDKRKRIGRNNLTAFWFVFVQIFVETGRVQRPTRRRVWRE